MHDAGQGEGQAGKARGVGISQGLPFFDPLRQKAKLVTEHQALHPSMR